MNKRQLWRAKCTVGAFVFINCIQVLSQVVMAQLYDNGKFEWEGKRFTKKYTEYFDRGLVVEYTNLEEFCHR